MSTELVMAGTRKSRYRLDENPKDCVLPVLELRYGVEGVIRRVAIHEDFSIIFDRDGNRLSLLPFQKSRLSDYNTQEMLKRLADSFGYPLDELIEVSDLEAEYRASHASANSFV
jgi:hypothetical protein